VPNKLHKPIDIVKDVLKRAELNPEPIDGEPGFKVSFSDAEEGPPVDGFLYVLPDEERVVFYLEYKERVPKSRRQRMAELITRANHGITIGNFEMNFDAGGVRYKTSLDHQGVPLHPLMVRSIILAAMAAVKVYSNAISQVMQGKNTPSEALAEVEHDAQI